MTDWHQKMLTLLEDIGERLDGLDVDLKARHLFAYNAVTLAAVSPAKLADATLHHVPSKPADASPGSGGATVTPQPRPVTPRPGGAAIMPRQMAEITF
jgi:hypothetical protein